MALLRLDGDVPQVPRGRSGILGEEGWVVPDERQCSSLPIRIAQALRRCHQRTIGVSNCRRMTPPPKNTPGAAPAGANGGNTPAETPLPRPIEQRSTGYPDEWQLAQAIVQRRVAVEGRRRLARWST